MNNYPPSPTLGSSRSKPVDEQTADILQTTQHIDKEVAEAKRLRQAKDTLLNAHERNWIDNVIGEVEDAVDAVVRLLEPCRVERDVGLGKLGVGRKMLWMLRDNQKVKGKYSRLIVTHQSLTTVMSMLHSRNQAVDNHSLAGHSPMPDRPVEGPPSYELSQMLDWRQSKQQSRLRNSIRSPGTSGRGRPAELE